MKKTVFLPSLVLIFTILLGVFGYRILSHHSASYIDCLYMTIITISTVGYGEVIVANTTDGLRLFNMMLIILGMGNLLFVLTTFTSLLVSGEIQKYFRRRKVMRIIKKFENHFIVCGAGHTALHMIQELIKSNCSFVVIEKEPNQYEQVLTQFPDINIMQGDATNDDILLDAGLEKAAAIACALPLDKDNLFLTLTAHHLNPAIRIISKVVSLENKRKLIRAGASSVIPPKFIGALRFASELIRPQVVSFLDTMLRDTTTVRINETVVGPNSPSCGKSLSELNIPKQVGVHVIAIKQPDSSTYNYSPNAADIIQPNTILFTISDPKKIDQLQRYINGSN